MVYRDLKTNTKAVSIASKYAYTPYFDIVWSFEYAISGNLNTEAGFTIFITEDVPLLGGDDGSSLAYSGLSAYNSTLSAVNIGLSGGLIAVGLDTLGIFPVSTYIDSTLILDGININQKINNSISVRGEYPTYSYNTYSFNQPISNTDASFKIVESKVKYKTIRARLGNIGRTLYIDYRENADDDFKPIFEQPVVLPFDQLTKFKIGASFATPTYTDALSCMGNIYIKNFHTEGRFESGATTTYGHVVSSSLLTTRPIITALPPDLYPLFQIPTVSIPILENTDNIFPNISLASARISSIDNGSGFTEDPYNFAYKLSLSSVTNTIPFTRVNVFRYISDSTYTGGKYILYKDQVCDFWTLSGLNVTVPINNSFYPLGNWEIASESYTSTYL